MAGWTTDHARDLARYPSSRRRPDPDLFCQRGSRGLARMKVLERLQDCVGLRFPVVTIGNFDGVHVGHQAVLKVARDRVRSQRGTAIVLTFEPHPLRVLTPGVELKFLCDPEEKLSLLEEAGVDVVVRLPFTREFAAQTPDEFMVQVLHDGLGTRELFVGQNFRFGKERLGTIHTLMEGG
ncbi:MAG: hypothetical protein E6K68_10630, partial [Nitrospirae bacterium]